MPSLPPTIPQPSVPGLPGTSLPKPKAPKHHAKRHVTTRSRHCAKTHARRHMVTTHARRHVTTHVLGRVATHHMRLNVRYGPGTGYRVIGSRHAGRTVAITCKKRGSNILGNKRWYKLAHHKGYVSAHYVVNRRTVPWC
jgi:hypothetical protein